MHAFGRCRAPCQSQIGTLQWPAVEDDGSSQKEFAKVELLYVRVVAHGGSGQPAQLVFSSASESWESIMASTSTSLVVRGSGQLNRCFSGTSV